MDVEKFTDRARGFIQLAQSLATREGNQRFTSPHLLKVRPDDEERLKSSATARPLKRAIQRYVQDPLAEMILAGDMRDGTTVRISTAGGNLTFDGKKPEFVDEDEFDMA